MFSIMLQQKVKLHMKLHEPDYNNGRNYPQGPQRKKRKDKGTKKSILHMLTGAVPVSYVIVSKEEN